MAPQPRVLRAQRRIIGHFDVVNPNAAGIDAGSEKHFVSVPEDRDEQPVRTFGAYTADLEALADWLVECGITTVAIEATGVYWVALYEVLEQRGLRPRLVDSKSIGQRNRKTDVLDCQWLRQLHTFGLLNAAFRPSDEILPLRSLTRQRKSLIEGAAQQIQRMQKALDLMNVKLHKVLSDVVGVTGLRIIRSIVAGKHSPEDLAALREKGCKADEESFVKALTGNYRQEHIFALKQALELFDFHHRLLSECDATIESQLGQLEKRSEVTSPASKKRSRRKNQPHFDGTALLHQLTGVNLVEIDGLESATVLTILSEIGPDVSPWPNQKAWTSWLGLATNRRITGGKPINKRGPRIQPNRVAQALRLAAQTLERSDTALGAFFRRIRARHGRKSAIKATARKLAIIIYTMLKNQTPYRDSGADYYEQRYRESLLKSLTRKALNLGYVLVPNEAVH